MSVPMPYMPNLRPERYAVESDRVTLSIRQQPQQALVTLENKEKARKPVDPPPIVQLTVNSGDPLDRWLVSPYLFMIATLMEGEHGDKAVTGKAMLGQNSSSLNRLKDINNKDGGFFIFGDISIRRQGVYRLRFNLFNTDVEREGSHVQFLSQVTSAPFHVLPSKEFRGLMESTHLSRTFSDQGVRLRLRKEARALGGTKRRADDSPDGSPNDNPNPTSYGSTTVGGGHYGYGTPHVKRQRSESSFNNPNLYAPFADGTTSLYSNNTYGSARTWVEQGHQTQSYHHPSVAHLPESSTSASPTLARMPQSVRSGAASKWGQQQLNHHPALDRRSSQFDQHVQSSHSQGQMRTPTADSYRGLGGLQTPTSISDVTGMAPPNGRQSYNNANLDYLVASGAVGDPATAYHPRTVPLNPAADMFHPGAQLGYSVIPYDQQSHASSTTSQHTQSHASQSAHGPLGQYEVTDGYPGAQQGPISTHNLMTSTLNSGLPSQYQPQFFDHISNGLPHHQPPELNTQPAYPAPLQSQQYR